MKNINLLAVSIVISTPLLFAATPAVSAEPDTIPIDLHIGTGVAVFTRVFWGFIPTRGAAVAMNADVGKWFRVRTDVNYHLAAEALFTTFGAGIVFRPVGANAQKEGGFQLKLPLLGEVGFLSGKVEAGDGYNDTLRWFLYGASLGVDFIWRKAQKAGFCISVKGGYLFKKDTGSQYAGIYSYHNEALGSSGASILLGIVN